jgi:DNA-binding response OmpR family regulator
MRLLLIEDHAPLAEAIGEALARAGFTVDRAGTARQARSMAATVDYGLVVLDLGLPDGDGLRLLPELRAGGRVPVIVLTARDALADRLAGLDGGADDYILKPVEMSELAARCRAVLRRPGDRAETLLQVGPIRFDTIRRNVTADGRPVTLGRRETAILEQLMRAAGRVVARGALEEALYGFDDDVTPNALEAAMSRLRKALAAAGSPLPIVTVRGIGWMLARGSGS